MAGHWRGIITNDCCANKKGCNYDEHIVTTITCRSVSFWSPSTFMVVVVMMMTMVEVVVVVIMMVVVEVELVMMVMVALMLVVAVEAALGDLEDERRPCHGQNLC